MAKNDFSFNQGNKAYEPKLFEPVEGRPMLEVYPELEEIPQFRDLGGDKYIRFVWYFGCKSSKFYPNTDIEEKTLLCLRAAGLVLRDAERESWLAGNFPDRIKDAIQHMGVFNIDVRTQSYNLALTVLQNATSIITKSPEELNLMPWDDKKKYMDIATDYIKQLPSLISQVESKFGLQVRSKKIVKGGREKTHADEVLHNT